MKPPLKLPDEIVHDEELKRFDGVADKVHVVPA